MPLLTFSFRRPIQKIEIGRVTIEVADVNLSSSKIQEVLNEKQFKSYIVTDEEIVKDNEWTFQQTRDH
jgi:hypothetical protein